MKYLTTKKGCNHNTCTGKKLLSVVSLAMKKYSVAILLCNSYPWKLCVKIKVILPFLRETFLSFVLLARVGWGYFVKFLSRFYLVNVTLLVSFTGWAQIWPRKITCHIRDNNKTFSKQELQKPVSPLEQQPLMIKTPVTLHFLLFLGTRNFCV